MHASLRAAVLLGIGVVAMAAAEPPAAPADKPPAGKYDAQAAATKEYALKGLALYKAEGQEAAKKAFMTPKAWLLGPDHFNLHISGLADDNQMVWADSGFPEVVGLSYHDVADLDGVPLGDVVWGGLAKSPTGAAVQVRFNDPVTKTVAHAEGYCVRADPKNVICAWSEVPL
jgi:hypothetical protein